MPRRADTAVATLNLPTWQKAETPLCFIQPRFGSPCRSPPEPSALFFPLFLSLSNDAPYAHDACTRLHAMNTATS